MGQVWGMATSRSINSIFGSHAVQRLDEETSLWTLVGGYHGTDQLKAVALMIALSLIQKLYIQNCVIYSETHIKKMYLGIHSHVTSTQRMLLR